MYLMREQASLKATSIGKLVGGKNHATVLNACKRISSLLIKDTVIQRDVYRIRELAAAS
jgi:chromosomal replication initiator protein